MSAQDQERVLSLMTGTNKPYSLQQLQDFLAVHGLKKAAITKAVDVLIETGKVRPKEFGKTKLFTPDQSRMHVLSKQELEVKTASNNALKQEVAQEREKVKAAESELASLHQALTLEQIQQKISSLQEKKVENEQELDRLKDAQGSNNPEDREQIAKEFVLKMGYWRKHQGIFRAIWNELSEGIDRKEKDVFEEIGIDTDKTVGADFKKLDALFSTVRINLNKEARKRRY